MLLFIQLNYNTERGGRQISKHLMLLFIVFSVQFPAIQKNFKTSHVIVYQELIEKEMKSTIFQNISCYCLSDPDDYCWTDEMLFQNISCYCLSLAEVEDWSELEPFQNISCYCLSVLLHFLHQYLFISKHLMLLFIRVVGNFQVSTN